MAYGPEVKALALAGAMLGQSVRQIKRTLSEQLNEPGPALATIHEWISAAGDSATFAQSRFAAQASLHLAIMDAAGAAVLDKLNNPGDLSMQEVNMAYGTSADKVLALAKLRRDVQHDNLLARALEAALDLPIAERRAALAAAGMPVRQSGGMENTPAIEAGALLIEAVVGSDQGEEAVAPA